MRILITGAQGLIGRAVVKGLVSEGLSLTCLSRREIPKSTNGVRWIKGDLVEQGVAEKVIEGQDAIVHLAHDSTPLTTSSDLIADARRSLFPSLQLIQAIVQSGHKPHVIYLSSGGAVYGGSAKDRRRYHETDVCAPVMAYGIQKLTVERYLHYAAENGSLRSTVLRVSNAYGDLLPAERMQGLIGTSISRILTGKPLRLIGNPLNVRDYVHISDVVAAVRKALNLVCDFEIINIGSGIGYSVIDVLELISRVSGNGVPILREEVAGSGLLPNWCVLDVSKARNILAWEANVSLEDGIAAMFAKAQKRNANLVTI